MKIQFAGTEVESDDISWATLRNDYNDAGTISKWEVNAYGLGAEEFPTQAEAELRLLEILKQIHEGK